MAVVNTVVNSSCVRVCGSALVASAVALATQRAADAAFVGYTVVATNVTNSGQNLTRYEVFANFNGPTDTVLNTFNFQALGGWAGHVDAAGGFWQKDNLDSTSPGVLRQTIGTWAPYWTGSATANRPFDSFLVIGGNPTTTNTTTADPSWNGGGANPNGWNMAQLPLYNDLGWFNSSPPNLQGRVGTAPNTATTVKIGQFILSQNDPAFRTYTLRIAVNNAGAATPVFSDASFTLCSTVWYRDLDGDGFGASVSGTQVACAQPSGYVLNNSDCNDSSAAINPNTIWYRDIDGDGFGAAVNGTATQCTQPAGYVLNNTDNCPSLSNPSQVDCNNNGIGDVCDIVSGSYFDCNFNGIPDSCDLAAGTSTDLNNNGRPDECAEEWIVGGSGYATLAAAITAAPTNTTINVAPGTHAASILVSTKKLHLRSLAGAATTTLSGSGMTSSILAFESAATNGSTVTGFTFRDGTVGHLLDTYRVGGAIAVISSSITIDNCVFTSNAAGYGGAVYCLTSASTIRNCAFTNNSSVTDGGALEFGAGGGWSVLNCSFSGNTSAKGGAIHLWGTHGAMTDSTFSANTATDSGGAISWYTPASAGVLLDGCSLEANNAQYGGAIYLSGGADSIGLLDTRFCRNSPEHILGPSTDLGGNHFSGDCNGNGICDLDDITSGLEQDCNGNDQPDACDLSGTVIGFGDDEHAQATAPLGLGTIRQISAGCTHSLALKADGTVVAWGFNSFGQATVPAGLIGVTQISAGCDHNAALKSDGTVALWGYNEFGQCTAPAGLSSVMQVSAGGNQTAALKNDGSIVAWGRNVAGEATVPAGLPASAEVVCGGAHTIARRSDGTLTCWGLNNFGQCNTPANVGVLTQVVAGCYHTAGLRDNGTVVCWGSNLFGQIAVPAGLNSVTKLAAGVGQHTLALKADGSVRAWGWNAFGQTTLPSPLAAITEISAGGTHSLARTLGAPDCNENNVIDSCDIADGTSTDVDSNGVPDDCKPDCDMDGLPDAWELAQGLDSDCDLNSNIDSCDLAAGDSDINNNDVHDACELLRGDLNLDGAVNSADLAFILAAWGSADPHIGDLNRDGAVNAADVAMLLAEWGTPP